MKNYVFCFLLTLLIFVASCDSQNGTSEIDKSSEVRVEAKLELQSEEQKYDRLVQMDLAVSRWYMHEQIAALALQSFVDFEIGPIYKGRRSKDILQEQQKIIDFIEKKPRPFSDELKAGLEAWREHQIEAINQLMEVLGKPKIKMNKEYEFKFIFNLHKVNFDQLAEERKVLERNGVDPLLQRGK
jgi:hypothetical protein